ncbi:hypothetical protein lerEdw1_004134 [Lerista edwardsae]|nr:hypothetical protein lerEdw1_004134 [Lerista edwardsae]
MDSVKLQVLVFYLAVGFGPSQSQGYLVFQPKIRKVSMIEYFNHLQVEWDVHNDSKTYPSKTVIVFNIQVNQTEDNHIVNNTNYTVSLSELKQPLKWSWDPLVPLQCEPHVVRIRSLVRNTSFPHSETWSDWSPWEAVAGLKTVDDDENYIFPENQIVKVGSNVTFCCIAKKTGTVDSFHFSNKKQQNTNTKQRKVLFHLKDSSPDSPNVFCRFSDGPRGTQFYAIEPPYKPENFSCETENKTRCTWKINTEKHPTLYNLPDGLCNTELILSDVPYTKTYCKVPLKEEDSCSFTIGKKPRPKLRLIAKNCVGENYADDPSDEPQSGDFPLGIPLLLGIVSLMLIISISCYTSSCVRNRYFRKIPHPDVSPFLKLNLGTMKIYDVPPDELEVMENHQTSTGKQPDLGSLIMENLTYFDPAYHRNLQEQEAENKNFNPPSTSYKPLQDFFANEPISQSPPHVQGNFTYISGMEEPDSVALQGDLPRLVEDMQDAEYKPQQTTQNETNPPDEYVHSSKTC